MGPLRLMMFYILSFIIMGGLAGAAYTAGGQDASEEIIYLKFNISFDGPVNMTVFYRNNSGLMYRFYAFREALVEISYNLTSNKLYFNVSILNVTVSTFRFSPQSNSSSPFELVNKESFDVLSYSGSYEATGWPGGLFLLRDGRLSGGLVYYLGGPLSLDRASYYDVAFPAVVNGMASSVCIVPFNVSRVPGLENVLDGLAYYEVAPPNGSVAINIAGGRGTLVLTGDSSSLFSALLPCSDFSLLTVKVDPSQRVESAGGVVPGRGVAAYSSFHDSDGLVDGGWWLLYHTGNASLFFVRADRLGEAYYLVDSVMEEVYNVSMSLEYEWVALAYTGTTGSVLSFRGVYSDTGVLVNATLQGPPVVVTRLLFLDLPPWVGGDPEPVSARVVLVEARVPVERSAVGEVPGGGGYGWLAAAAMVLLVLALAFYLRRGG